jgi:CDP-diacylglycerol--glycerol-3-phosphate 3-phosphatidyltransferase
MHNRIYYIVNAITAYRLLAAFVLLYLIITGRIDVFKWLLAFSFFTDFLDGYLARKFKVVSTLGAKLDSIADDLTVLMAIIAVIVFDPRFVRYELVLTIIVFGTYCIQTLMALVRYGRLTGFHTYIAKCAALFQGLFFILFFFLPRWPLLLFYLACFATLLELIEEIFLIILLPEWQTDVKGLYWVIRKRKKHSKS